MSLSRARSAAPVTGGAFLSGTLVLTTLVGCATTEPPAEPPSETPAVPPVASSEIARPTLELPPANAQFDYQLGGPYAPQPSVGIVARDRTADPAEGVYNICYVNLLQTQPDADGEPDPERYGTTAWWDARHPELLLRDDEGELVLDEEWDEVVFDVRTQAQREALFAVQRDWLDGCATDGFDAIEPDNLDAYTRSADLMTFDDALAYLQIVVPYVHGLNLAIAQKNVNGEFAALKADQGVNGTDFITSTVPAQGFDFAIAEECAVYDECGQYAAAYGDLFYEIEYTDNNPNQTRNGITRSAFEWACHDHGSAVSVILRDRDVATDDQAAYRYEHC